MDDDFSSNPRSCITEAEKNDLDADRWAAFSAEERTGQRVRQAAMIYPQIPQEYEIGLSKVWSQDRFTGGVCTFFESGQEACLYVYMVAPEWPIYFAWEHTSPPVLTR